MFRLFHFGHYREDGTCSHIKMLEQLQHVKWLNTENHNFALNIGHKSLRLRRYADKIVWKVVWM